MSLLTASGEAHGLINTIGNSVAFDDFKHMDPKTKAKVEKEKKEDSKMVRARYINQRSASERLDKAYCRYSGDPIRLYHFIPNFVYEIPMGLVKEVNEKKEVKRSGLVSENGEPMRADEAPMDKDVYHASRHQFVPVSF